MFMVGKGMARSCTGLSRRDFLRVGSLGAFGMSLTGVDEATMASTHTGRSVIWLMLVGGPSHLETWDPKPDAPAEVRGPFGSIATAVPGVRINEHLPRLASRLDRVALIRSLHHDAAPIHETGQQLLQTGKLCRRGLEHPHFGSIVARACGGRNGLPPFVMVPGPIVNTGVDIPHGQSAGALGAEFEPFHIEADPAAPDYDPLAVIDRARRHRGDVAEGALSRSASAFDLSRDPEALRSAYGRTRFGQSCLLARRLVEAGVRVVTVNMFESVFNRVTWDCHGAAPFSSLNDYASSLLPEFDQAFSALLDDLYTRGLLDSTLVVATGEFGRTPKLNSSGGRDHWPAVWSAAVAGGGVNGGQVLGASDAHAAEPASRPVSPAELLATVYASLRVQPPEELAIEGARPVAELFA
jgi:uncharacterized protein (DUF1501 family)